MPGGDRTGPAGMGPMTGRAAGFCAGYPAPGFVGGGYGRGFGGGRGRGRGNWGYGRGAARWTLPAFVGAGYPAPPPSAPAAPATSDEQLVDALKQQLEGLTQALNDVKSRIAELEAQPKGE